MQRFPTIALIFVCFASTAGCSNSRPNRPDPFAHYPQAAKRAAIADSHGAAPEITHEGNFKVSVNANGKKVSDFNDRLIHQVTISRKDLALISGTQKELRLPFVGKPEVDHSGKLAGVRLTEVRTKEVLPTLGLEDGDLVTAVGKKHTSSFADLRQIALELKKNHSTTATMVRRGRPHKIFYSLN